MEFTSGLGVIPKIEIKIYKSEKNFTECRFFLNFAYRSYLRSSRGVHNLGSWARGEPKFLGVIFFIVTIFSETLRQMGGFGARFESTGIVVQNGLQETGILYPICLWDSGIVWQNGENSVIVVSARGVILDM